MANLTEDERPSRKARAVFEWSPESVEALLSLANATQPVRLHTPPHTGDPHGPPTRGASRAAVEDVNLTGDAPSLYVRQQLTRLGELAEPKPRRQSDESRSVPL